MAKQSVSNTALGAAICRLIEQYEPPETRLFDDPVVKDLVGAPLRVMMGVRLMRDFTVKQTEAVMRGLYGAQICRARYDDDVVMIALAGGIRQVVLLGAGLDTRAYRLPGIEGAEVFEVDLPSVQRNKEQKIEARFGRLPENVTYIPIDFDTQTLNQAFAGTGFDPSKLAVFIWEGVTQYISEEAVRQTLSYVGKSAPGSILAFTYVLKSIIERRSDIPGVDKMMDRVAKQSPWIFGLEPGSVQAYLEPFHLLLNADVGNPDYQAKYLKPLGRDLVVSESERIAKAVVTRP